VTTYVYRDGELVNKADYYSRPVPTDYHIHVTESFKSPIDGRMIHDKSQLANHNREHGVTDHRDYGDKWFADKAKQRDLETRGQTASAKRERIELIKHTLEQHRR